MPGDVLTLVGMLALVILILFLAYWVTRWIGSSGARGTFKRAAGGGYDRFCIIGQLSVGRNERLLLVRLQEKCYLLGVTANSVTLLKELDEADAKEWLDQNDRPAPPSFADILKENLWKKK